MCAIAHPQMGPSPAGGKKFWATLSVKSRRLVATSFVLASLLVSPAAPLAVPAPDGLRGGGTPPLGRTTTSWPGCPIAAAAAFRRPCGFSQYRSGRDRLVSSRVSSSSSPLVLARMSKSAETGGEGQTRQAQAQTAQPSSAAVAGSAEWELDCYSRPVVSPKDNKKLWEVLITDSEGKMRICQALPSNRVNSRELRAVVEKAIDEADVKPSTIRFFRGAMFNMINIALSEVEVVARPSRATYALAQWLEERNRDVYPKMEGYKPSMAATNPSGFLDIRTPVKLPDALRGEKYAFVSLPLAEFREGGGVTAENIGVGRLCPIDPSLPSDSFVQGLVILSSRAKALASWLAGTEVCSIKCDLRRRTLSMEADISTQYLMARLDDAQREEGAVFEEGKDRLGGLHFVSVQEDEDDDPAGFWLLREIPGGL